MPNVLMGNVSVREVAGADEETGAPIYRNYDHNAVTKMHLPETWTKAEMIRQITHDDGFWPAHSGAAPAWVESDDEGLANVLSYFYGCPVGRPAGWEGLGQ